MEAKNQKLSYIKMLNHAAMLVFTIWIFSGCTLDDYNTELFKEDLGNGKYKCVERCYPFYSIESIGRLDEYGYLEGLVVINSYNISQTDYRQTLESTETVNYIHGKRHGTSTVKNADGSVTNKCYDMGICVPCNKAANIE